MKYLVVSEIKVLYIFYVYKTHQAKYDESIHTV